eukprot:GHVP01001835.1.p1 GENE.GHVP01001835.1~~GHVP01001835.1.p1  ORF type:complete len:125 (+),score=18.50 GHVP01001835.1:48-422(+)
MALVMKIEITEPRREARQVPLRNLRRFHKTIPKVLAEVAINEILSDQPRLQRRRKEFGTDGMEVDLAEAVARASGGVESVLPPEVSTPSSPAVERSAARATEAIKAAKRAKPKWPLLTEKMETK